MACAKIKVEFRLNRLYHELRDMKANASPEEQAAFDAIMERIGRAMIWTHDNFPDPRKKPKPTEAGNDNAEPADKAGMF